MTKTAIYRIVFIITIFTLLSACNAMQNLRTSEITGKFDERFRLYSKHLRWGHFRELTAFMTPERIAPALIQVDSFKERRITNVKPIAWLLDEQAGTMTGDVMIDYYVENRAVVRSVTQHQIWRRNGEIWQLDSGFPDLR